MPNFALLENRGTNISLINVDQIRLITDIRDGHCTIRFNDKFIVELTGEGADQFIGNLFVESKLVDGTPMIEAFEKYRAKKSSSPTSESQT